MTAAPIWPVHTSADPAESGVRLEPVSRDTPDGELAERACYDAEAFGLLYERYADQIFRMVYHRLRHRADAEDVTAEVFVKALRAIHGYRPARAPFWGWLHRIAANAVVDHVRARRATVSLDVVADARDPRVGVEDRVVGRVEAADAWRAVSVLPPAQRTAVTLRLGGDLPIADIAARMSRSEGAVKLLLNRGVSSVRGQLADASPERVPGR